MMDKFGQDATPTLSKDILGFLMTTEMTSVSTSHLKDGAL